MIVMNDTAFQQGKKNVVRIDVNCEVGSGFLFIPEGKEFIYIFTALHVLQFYYTDRESTETFQVGYFSDNGMQTYESRIDASNLCVLIEDRKYSCEEIKNFGGTEKDIAVLKIPQQQIRRRIPDLPSCTAYQVLPPIKDSVPWPNEMHAVGYPDGKETPQPLEAQRYNILENSWELRCTNYTEEELPAKLAGFSGSGLFAYCDGQLPILTTITSCCKENETHGVFQGAKPHDLIQKMMELGWDTPEYASPMEPVIPDPMKTGQPVPDSYQDPVFKNSLNTIFDDMEGDVSDELYTRFEEFKNEPSHNPVIMAETDEFYDIPECTCGDRKQCAGYWCGKFWMHLLMEICKEDEDIWNTVQFDYICSEGRKNADVKTLVRPLLTKEHRPQENAVLLWQSQSNPSVSRLPKSRFKTFRRRIIENISYGEDFDDETQADIIRMQMRKNKQEFAIIHRAELIAILEGSSDWKEATDRIREVVRDVWK